MDFTKSHHLLGVFVVFSFDLHTLTELVECHVFYQSASDIEELKPRLIEGCKAVAEAASDESCDLDK